jgi:hypothetical protein
VLLGRCCSVRIERSEAREGRREVRGERRGKGEIDVAAATGRVAMTARLLGLDKWALVGLRVREGFLFFEMYF